MLCYFRLTDWPILVSLSTFPVIHLRHAPVPPAQAPEQLSGPCLVPGQPVSGRALAATSLGSCHAEAHVVRASDVYALGMLACFMGRNGDLPSRVGLPLDVPVEDVAKSGDRPRSSSGAGAGASSGWEPFYQMWCDLLPPAGPAQDVLRSIAQACLSRAASERPSLTEVIAQATAQLARVA